MADYHLIRLAEKPTITSLGLTDAKLTLLSELLGVSQEHFGTLRVLSEEKPTDEPGSPHLLLVHYVIETPANTHVRGLVVDVANGKVVATSFPATAEVTELPEVLSGFTDATVAVEGMLIRVFWYGGKKYFATCRNLNAYSSTWAGTTSTFGAMFSSTCDVEKLDAVLAQGRADIPECYHFIVSHPDVRIVCGVSKPKLTLVGVSVGNKLTVPTSTPSEECSVPEHISLDRVGERLSQLTHLQASGVLLFGRSAEGRLSALKVLSPGYRYWCEVRGGQPNLRLRWLELRCGATLPCGERASSEQLECLYPERKDVFDKLKEDLVKLEDWLGELYRRRANREVVVTGYLTHKYLVAARAHKGSFTRLFKEAPGQTVNALLREKREWDKNGGKVRQAADIRTLFAKGK